jgi:hypothetical protein
MIHEAQRKTLSQYLTYFFDVMSICRSSTFCNTHINFCFKLKFSIDNEDFLAGIMSTGIFFLPHLHKPSSSFHARTTDVRVFLRKSYNTYYIPKFKRAVSVEPCKTQHSMDGLENIKCNCRDIRLLVLCDLPRLEENRMCIVWFCFH